MIHHCRSKKTELGKYTSKSNKWNTEDEIINQTQKSVRTFQATVKVLQGKQESAFLLPTSGKFLQISISQLKDSEERSKQITGIH